MTTTGTPRVQLENEFVTLWYHPAGKIVHHKIHKPVTGALFREALERGVEIFERHGAQKWLSDDRGNGALHPDDSNWATTVWSPRVVAAGWAYWAIVLPDAALGRVNMKRFVNIYSDMGVSVRIYSTPEEALVWLRRPETADPPAP
ncbi:MAG: hypothetical protein U0271_28405 [Polyangiaceae bacterium]